MPVNTPIINTTNIKMHKTPIIYPAIDQVCNNTKPSTEIGSTDFIYINYPRDPHNLLDQRGI